MSLPADILMHDPPDSQSSFPPLCDSDSVLSSPRASSVTATPSVYLTFKVLRLVNTFRQRVRTRVQSSKKPSTNKTPAKFCQDFERIDFDEIDRYLGRKSAHSHNKLHVPSGKTTCATKEQPLSLTTNWLLGRINQAVKAGTYSVTTVASSNKLFVRRREDFTVSAEYLSTSDLTGLLVIIKDLLHSLSRLSSLPDRESTLCEGNEILHADFDEACTANLEHLLLCLKDQLLRLLVARLIALLHKHIIACQRDQGQHSKTWFFEYPNAQHPLSTTWPWSIRPSLAVLWGVCWMFYDRHRYDDSNKRAHVPRRVPTLRFDSEMNWVDERGQMVASSTQIMPFLSQLQQQHHGLQMGNTTRQVASLVPRPPRRLPPSSSAQTAMSASAPPQYCGAPSLSSHLFPRTSGASVGVAHHVSATYSLPDTNNNTYTAAPPAYDASPALQNPRLSWLPEDATFDYNPSTGHAYPPAHAWPSLPPQATTDQQQHQQQQQQATAFIGYPASSSSSSSPPRSRHHPPAPSISLTTDFSNFSAEFQPVQAAPQDIYQATPPVTSSSTFRAQEPLNNNFSYNPTQLSPQHTRFMNPDQQDMQTPPRSPRDQQVVAGESLSRKRSHSIMSNGAGHVAHLANGSRSGSVNSMHEHQSGEEDYSPRTRAFKREDAPPVNAEQKIICTFSAECVGLTFDRKCEWTKHMDKHDRPYRCSNPACAKLQGFTYSGGLLRHEREVHNKHGGPKSALMCPHKDCKRHNGKGFTRKENLNEHLRRVHPNKDGQAQDAALKHDSTTGDVFPGAEDLDPAATAELEAFDPQEAASPARKRRRQDDGVADINGGSGDVERLEGENRALQQKIHDQDMEITDLRLRLDAAEHSRQEEMASMHDSIRQLQEQLQQQAVPAMQAPIQTQS